MPEHSGVTVPNAEPVSGEELEAQFGAGGDPAGAGGGAGDAGEGSPGSQEGSPGTPPPTPGPTKVKLGEDEYDEAELRALLEFQEWARANQDKMQAFGQFVQGEADFVPKGASDPPKPEGDPDPYDAIEDPDLRERLRTQEQQLEALRQSQNQQVTAASLQEAERGINRAFDTIKERYGLDDEQVQELANSTAQSGILPGIRSTQPDPYEAALLALDTTLWRDPKWRDKTLESEITRLSAHEQRQALAGAVGGSPGAGSREVPSDQEVAKMSPQEKVDAMAAEVAHAMRGHT